MNVTTIKMKTISYEYSFTICFTLVCALLYGHLSVIQGIQYAIMYMFNAECRRLR